MSIEEGMKATCEAEAFRDRLLAEIRMTTNDLPGTFRYVRVLRTTAYAQYLIMMELHHLVIPMEYFGTPRLNTYIREAIDAI